MQVLYKILTIQRDRVTRNFVKYHIQQQNLFFLFSNNTAVQTGYALYGGSGNSKDLTFNNSESVNSKWSLESIQNHLRYACVSARSKPQCNLRLV